MLSVGSGLCLVAAVLAPTAPTNSATDGALRRRVLASVFVGIHQYQDSSSADAFDVGLRFGALVGWRVPLSSWVVPAAVSFNVEGLEDRLRPRVPAGAWPRRQWVREVALSPLVHVGLDQLQLVIGPKVGLWFLTDEVKAPLGDFTIIERGWTLGANAGIFFVTRLGLSLGMLLNLQTRELTRSCTRSSDGSESCPARNTGWAGIFGTSLALLY